jgi:acyl-CoA synthetase (AMP-forming)/AMP-acid ligase II
MPAEPRIPLGEWARAGAAPAALAVTPEHDRAALLARIGAWRTAFAGVPGRKYALHLDDSFDFAAALFGGWLAGKTLWLPGDTLPATLERLRDEVDGWAGELPGGLKPAQVAADAEADAGALDPDACELVLFTSGSTGEPGAITKTLRQLDSEIESLEAQFGAALGDALVQGTVSHQHIYGLLFRVLWPLSARW